MTPLTELLLAVAEGRPVYPNALTLAEVKRRDLVRCDGIGKRHHYRNLRRGARLAVWREGGEVTVVEDLK